MFRTYEFIKSLCDEWGVSPSKMCEDIGSSKSLMSGLKSGRTKGINEKTAQAIADYFNVSVSRVLHGIDDLELAGLHLSHDEIEVALRYRRAPDAVKEIVDVALKPYAEVEEIHKTEEDPEEKEIAEVKEAPKAKSANKTKKERK